MLVSTNISNGKRKSPVISEINSQTVLQPLSEMDLVKTIVELGSRRLTLAKINFYKKPKTSNS